MHREGLIPRQIVDINGKTTTVYILPGNGPALSAALKDTSLTLSVRTLEEGNFTIDDMRVSEFLIEYVGVESRSFQLKLKNGTDAKLTYDNTISETYGKPCYRVDHSDSLGSTRTDVAYILADIGYGNNDVDSEIESQVSVVIDRQFAGTMRDLAAIISSHLDVNSTLTRNGMSAVEISSIQYNPFYARQARSILEANRDTIGRSARISLTELGILSS